MINYRTLYEMRLRQEVEAYATISTLTNHHLAHEINRTSRRSKNFSLAKPLTYRALDGLRNGASPQENTAAQVSHFLLRKFKLPEFMLRPHRELTRAGAVYAAYHEQLRSSILPLDSYVGMYVAHGRYEEHEIAVSLVLDRDQGAVLLARALLTYTYNSVDGIHFRSDRPTFSVRVALHGYALPFKDHFYFHLEDHRQPLPYIMVSELPPDLANVASREPFAPLGSDWAIEMYGEEPIVGTIFRSTVQCLFPKHFAVAIEREFHVRRLIYPGRFDISHFSLHMLRTYNSQRCSSVIALMASIKVLMASSGLSVTIYDTINRECDQVIVIN